MAFDGLGGLGIRFCLCDDLANRIYLINESLISPRSWPRFGEFPIGKVNVDEDE